MKRVIKIAKWAIVPVVASLVWVGSQAFMEGAASSTQVSYDVATTSFNTVVQAPDTSLLTVFDKINTMVYREKVSYSATLSSDGNFHIVATHLTPPTLGGKPLPLNNVTTVTMTPSGFSTNAQGPFPYAPGDLEKAKGMAAQLASMATSCSGSTTQIAALAQELQRKGAKVVKVKNLTSYTVGDTETILDLEKGVYVSEIVRENGKLVSDVYYEYDYSGTTPGSDAVCPVLKRIVSRGAMKSSRGVDMFKVEINELSNVKMSSRSKK